MKKDLKIIVENSGNEPDYYKMAHTLLVAARKFYNKPENERAYQEWIKEQREKIKEFDNCVKVCIIECGRWCYDSTPEDPGIVKRKWL